MELTTAYELSDDEARTILKKIEKSSGRTVEATRKVDSALIGGIILQVGSLPASTQASAAASTDYATNS